MKDTAKASIPLPPMSFLRVHLDPLDLDRAGQCQGGESLTAFFKFIGIRIELPSNLTQKVLTQICRWMTKSRCSKFPSPAP